MDMYKDKKDFRTNNNLVITLNNSNNINKEWCFTSRKKYQQQQ